MTDGTAANDSAGTPVSSHYRGESGRRYAEVVQRHRRVTGLLNRAKFAPHVRETDVVLDFGCSSGELLQSLTVAERIGVEVNPVTRAEAAAVGIDVHESLQAIEPASVDVVISNHVLEHSLAPFAVLHQIRRVLRPGGRLVLCVPADDWRNERVWRPGDANHHVFAWTPLSLGNLLTEAGFMPDSITMRHRAWPPMYHHLYRLPGPLWGGLCWVWATVRRSREIVAIATWHVES